MFDLIWRGVAIGLGATILMDIWAVILWKVLGQGAPDWAMVGRWCWHLQSAKVFHHDIADAAPFAQEQALGWIFHYAVGILYGVILAVFMGPTWLAAPTFLPALLWGIVTVAGGWFLLQPGLGIGRAASKTANPTRSRAMNLMAHTVFALGLWGTALLTARAAAKILKRGEVAIHNSRWMIRSLVPTK